MTRAMLKISSINSQRFGIVNIYLPLFIQKGQGDPLEKEIATYSSILAWEIPSTDEAGGLQSMGVTKQSDMT